MSALQETPLSARAEAPHDFYRFYASEKIVTPAFVLFLFVLLLIKTGSAIFAN